MSPSPCGVGLFSSCSRNCTPRRLLPSERRTRLMYAVAEPWPLEAAKVPRDDHWLSRQLDRIWDTFFRDIPRVNSVKVSFARHWRARLGLITFSDDTGITYIGINA